VTEGDAKREIPACAGCHGPAFTGTERAARSPRPLFAAGSRHNDISEQMLNIARQMTPAEMTDVAQYFASQP
jgi:cytochrome c553